MQQVQAVRMRDVDPDWSNATERNMTLPLLPKFSGEKQDGVALDWWMRKLQHHAELEQWTEHLKLLLLELHLSGKAEQGYEMFPWKRRDHSPKPQVH